MPWPTPADLPDTGVKHVNKKVSFIQLYHEEAVLLETKMSKPGKQVFRLQFPIGEYDMVVVDPTTIECEVYEIKHSAERVPAQYRFLEDAEKLASVEFRYGRVKKKAVIYRGQSSILDNGIEYLNVEDYLKSLYSFFRDGSVTRHRQLLKNRGDCDGRKV